MATEGEVTGTVAEDGILTVGEGDAAVKYVKEADLTAVQTKLTAAEKAQGTVESTAVGEARAATLKAETDVERLTQELKDAGDNKDKVATVQKELETAKEAGKSTADALLELRREVIVTGYGVPKETVAEKDLKELETFEEALKSVGVLKKAGNLAIGGDAGSGASSLEGVSPMELARRAYESSNAK